MQVRAGQQLGGKASPKGWSAEQRLAPLGSFAMGVDFIEISRFDGGESQLERALVVANGSDWAPQAVTLHRCLPDGSYESLPSWFSEDYDYHMGVAVGDLTGNGFDDLVVSVFAGKDQNLSGGGIKVYLGGPCGLSRTPIWFARGFAASCVALADMTGDGSLDVLVACIADAGTIQKPELGPRGELLGHARFLKNTRNDLSQGLSFETLVLQHPASRGCGGVCIADVDLDGHFDVVFAGQRTAVLYGKPDFTKNDPFGDCDVWQSEEEHPFSFCAQAFRHPAYEDGLLVVSSRGLFCMAQLAGRTLSEVAPELLVHRPSRRLERSRALQHLAPMDEKRPEVPAGLAVVHGSSGAPEIVAGFLDARGRDIRGAKMRVFRVGDGDLPFATRDGEAIAGGGLMAGHVRAWRHRESWQSQRVTCFELPSGHGGVLTPHRLPLGDVLTIREVSNDGGEELEELAFTISSDRGTLRLNDPVSRLMRVAVYERGGDSIDLVASSSAAWPPAGATQVFRFVEESEERRSGTFKVGSASGCVPDVG